MPSSGNGTTVFDVDSDDESDSAGEADEDAKHHDARHEVVGQGPERIRRHENGEEIELARRGIPPELAFVPAIDPMTGTVDTFTGLVSAYTYSDMTGFVLSTVGTPSG